MASSTFRHHFVDKIGIESMFGGAGAEGSRFPLIEDASTINLHPISLKTERWIKSYGLFSEMKNLAEFPLFLAFRYLLAYNQTIRKEYCAIFFTVYRILFTYEQQNANINNSKAFLFGICA